jgi:phage repressor protein C with HTH and peptisase S24 domain
MEIRVPSPLAADDPRQILDRLIAERGEDYAGLSRMIGRNPAYIQQYIKRGSPRRLEERDRALLARYFRIDEALLGAPPERAVPLKTDALMPVPRIDIGASAGAGSLGEDDRAEAMFAFDQRWLRRMSQSPQSLALIRVEGDSMLPTLQHGDDIMVDNADAATRLRDGIYVLRRDGALLVKRLSCGMVGDRVAIISDNSAYPAEHDVAVGDLDIVGRVLWTGRRVS